MYRFLIKTFQIIWASPNTLLGLLLGGISLLFGTRAQVERGCIEFHGGLIRSLLRGLPLSGGCAAMTLGHTIIGQDPDSLARCRDHEQVHVRQYERWGPFFLPVYLGWSLVLWLRKKDPYLDNPFEIEAYSVSDPRHTDQ